MKKNAFFFNVKMESSTLTAALSRTDILSRELIMTYYVVGYDAYNNKERCVANEIPR